MLTSGAYISVHRVVVEALLCLWAFAAGVRDNSKWSHGGVKVQDQLHGDVTNQASKLWNLHSLNQIGQYKLLVEIKTI